MKIKLTNDIKQIVVWGEYLVILSVEGNLILIKNVNELKQELKSAKDLKMG